MSKASHVIVIGAGAAGMLTAIATTREGATVELWEQSEKPGRELFIIGEGRCDATNVCDMEELLDSAVSNSKLLYSSFYGFINQGMIDLLEQAGLHLKVERGNWVSPQSDKSSDAISALPILLRQAGVRVCLNQKAKGLAVGEGVCKGVQCGGKMQTADRVVVATGDLSYPAIGSTGGGFKWVTDSDHRLTELSPVLIPFEMKETEMIKEPQGFSLRNIEVAVYGGERGPYREFREMLFTHFGVSGPVLLSVNSFCAKVIRKRPLCLVIDLKPALSWEQLDERILRDFSDSRSKQFRNVSNHLYPSKLIPVIIDRNSVDPNRKVNKTTREERRGLAEATRVLRLTLTNLRGYKEVIITQGSVSIKDANSFTMESRKIQGLYFAEEILGLDAVTGDFNPQIVWFTG